MWAMSTPWYLIAPAVGSSNRVISRAVVDLPQPDSPTRPSVSPACTVRLTPSTACTHLVPRARRPSPFVRKCIFTSSSSRRGAPSIERTPDLAVVVAAVIAMVLRQPGQDFGLEHLVGFLQVTPGGASQIRGPRDQLGLEGRAQVAAHPVAVLAARVEGAAARHGEQARRGAGDRVQRARRAGHRRDALQQAPRVR